MKLSWKLIKENASLEDDPGFRHVLDNVNRKGMIAAGLLGVLSVVINFSTNAIAGIMPAFTYSEPGASIVIWDKLVMLILSISFIWMSRTKRGPEWARLVGFLMVQAAAVAIIFDDLGQETVFTSHHYIGLMVLLLVASIAYKPHQTVAFAVVTMVVYLFTSSYVADRFAIEGYPLRADHFVYQLIVLFLAVGISTLLYRTRYDQYLARRQASDAEARVRELERAKSQFFANVSHEFRTPLTLIKGPLRDIVSGKYGKLDAEIERRLYRMDKSASQLQYLIDELLDLSSLEAGKLQITRQPTLLANTLTYVTASFDSLADSSDIIFEYENNAPDVIVNADTKRIGQVITNLLSNAFKYTPSGGRIRVLVERDLDDVVISVKDSGRGISSEDLPFIFDRFRTANQSEGGAGTGIGLALVNELVNLHNGRVEVESDYGFGSEFRVYLRCESIDEISNLDSISDVNPISDVLEFQINSDGNEESGAHEHTVLVVDDNDDMRSYLRDVLHSAYNVHEAIHGQDGLERARAFKPDMIIADVMMPVMDGLEFCEKIREDPTLNHVPIILLTAKASEQARKDGLLSRADDFMTKPFDSDELLIRAENLIEIRKSLHLKYGSHLAVAPSEINAVSRDEGFVTDVRSIVEREMSNSLFSVDFLADELAMSRRQLERRLRAAVNLSPAGFIRTIRLKRAAQLLERDVGSISAIARNVGFADSAYFSKLFKQTFGVTPSQYSSEDDARAL